MTDGVASASGPVPFTTLRRAGAGWLATCLAGIGLTAACGGPTEPEPEPPDIADLGVPEFALVDGLELRANIEITQENPSTRVRVRVSATNSTDQPVEFVAGNPCFVRPLVYARGDEGWIQYAGSGEVVAGLFLCPQVVVVITVPPGETLTLSNRTEFSLADWVGPEFRAGTHVVTATVSGVELLAGQVDAK